MEEAWGFNLMGSIAERLKERSVIKPQMIQVLLIYI